MSEKKPCSHIRQFYKKSLKERLEIIKIFSNLSNDEISSLTNNFKALDFESANRMIENVFSVMSIPLGIATNFIINQKEYLIPMAIEEPSVVAAASCAAKLARNSGGFIATSSDPIMMGQIQLTRVDNPEKIKKEILAHKENLIELANKQDSILIKLGGGANNLEIKKIETIRGTMLIVNLFVNVKDAMGANIVNTMVERIALEIEKITNQKTNLRIISNLALNRITKAKAIWNKDLLSPEIIEGILDADAFAKADPFRCTTHNKGIMNGIDAVSIATGNDFRALEAGAHAYTSFNTNYKPLTNYYKDKNGNLLGEIELPIAIGTVGGITQTHPTTKKCLKILGVQTSNELANIIASVGLAQNFAALRAMVKDGIQKSHMKLHSKNIAISAGAAKSFVDQISEIMVNQNNISINFAKKLIKEYALN